MAEICQILLVTLLLYLFWLPSGGSASVDSDGNSTGVLARPETEGQGKPAGTNGERQKSSNGGRDDYDRPSRFSSVEDYIIRLLSAYMILGCEAASNISVESTDGMRNDRGEHVMIQILSTFFKSDCKGGPSSFPKPSELSGLSDADIVIIDLLLAFYVDGCRGAVAATRLSKINIPASKLVLTNAKGFILRLLLTFLHNDCKGGAEKTVEDIGKPSDAGRHLQSVVLELFLLIFGVSLTRMEL